MYARCVFTVSSTVVAILALLGSAQTQAQTNAQATGIWSDPATWSAGEPATGTDANIDGSFTVTVDQPGEVAATLDVGTIATQTGNLDINAPGALTVGTVMRIGQTANSTGVVDMTGGSVAVNGVFDSPIGNGELLVGDNGHGTLNMSGGTFTSADEMFIGLNPTGVGVVNVSGGTLETLGRSIIVGFVGGNGTLDISGTGDVNARFDMLAGLGEGSISTINQSGGTIDAGFLFTNAFTGGAGSTVTMTQTGGTYTTRIAYVLGQGNGTTTQNHSGGVIDVLNNGEFVVGDGGGNSSIYNISGTADVNVARNFVAGRDGIGVVNMSGGTIDSVNVFLGDFDSSSGTAKIAGGTLTLTGNLNVGAALASNAPPVPVGTAGQALDADGTLIISGPGGTIDVAGNLLANPDDNVRFGGGGEHNDSTLVFEATSGGVSIIDVAGIADLTGAEIDFDLLSAFPLGTSFDLITAIDISADYLQVAEDIGRVDLAIVAGGNGEILRATLVPEPTSVVILAVGIVGLWGSRRQRGC
jgi:hypothetical protein